MNRLKQKLDFTSLDIAIAIGFVLMMIIALFEDLRLSNQVYNPNSLLGQFTASYGEVPGYLVMSVAFMIYVLSRPLKATPSILSIIGIGVVNTLAVSRFTNNLLLRIIGTILLIGLTAVIVYYFIPINEEFVLEAATRTVKISIIVPTAIVLTIKSIWGRVRFRDLSSSQNEFTPWYLPRGFNGNHSFPSGHTAMGWMVLCSILFIKDKTTRWIIGIISIIWGITVATGRVIIGAHYLSDVVFSTGIGLLVIHYYYKQQMTLLEDRKMMIQKSEINN